MKKIPIVLLVLILSYSGVLAQSTKKTKVLKPAVFTKRVTHIVAEKSRNYY